MRQQRQQILAWRVAVLVALVAGGSAMRAAAAAKPKAAATEGAATAKSALHAADVPDALRPWVGWALATAPTAPCPRLYADLSTTQCAFATSLSLALEASGGAFEATWSLFTEADVELPGEATAWPQAVEADGKHAIVVAKNGMPTTRLAAGQHRLTGRFAWNDLPQALHVPAASGLVRLRLDGRDVAEPKLEGDRLFLQKTAPTNAAQTDSLDVRIHRKILDEIPLSLETRLELTVAGKSREVTLTPILPPGFIPMALSSILPTRLDASGGLIVQARPGKWEIALTARHPEAVTRLARPVVAPPLPPEEVWVFEAREPLRLVNVEGPTSIDPSQTTLPDEWKSLPAYLMPAEAAMTFSEKRRGDPSPPPDQIRLSRTAWLDFDGAGVTIRDQLSGTVTRSWRLEMQQPALLGRAEVNGTSQLVTRGPAGLAGVELTQGGLALKADSRVEEGAQHLSATGWDVDLASLAVRLELPPGWRMLAVRGADAANGTWIRTWDLLNMFLLLVMTVAMARLAGLPTAVLTFAALILVLPEGGGAPRYTWLAILPAVALAQARLPTLFQRALVVYRLGAGLCLVAIAAAFCLHQLRVAIYPTLDRPGLALGEHTEPDDDGVTLGGKRLSPVHAAANIEIQQQQQGPAAGAPPSAPEPALDKEEASNANSDSDGALFSGLANRSAKQDFKYEYRQKNLAQRDPKANIQTGPGLPQWTWTSVALSWNGPVRKDQALRLFLMPPWLNRLLGLLRVLLTLALVVVLVVPVAWRRDTKQARRWLTSLAPALPLALALGAFAGARPARADFPTPQMLDELKARLTAAPACDPCASLARMELAVEGPRLAIRAEAHAAARVALPLPGNAQHWLPDTVLVDGQPATALLRGDNQSLWVSLEPGVHQIALSGRLPDRESIQIELPLKPGFTTVKSGDWDVDGLRDDGRTESSLTLTRKAHASSAAGTIEAAGTLPPFLRVERVLSIGLDWLTVTRVTRLAGSGTAATIKVPLLAGEHVTSSDVRVAGGYALVTLGANDATLTWEGTLEPTTDLKLTASKDTTWIEWWTVELSAMWHLTYEGIPVVGQIDEQGARRPQWRPWPGESVALKIDRPAAVEGRTVTIDRSELDVAPGLRSSESTLKLKARASLGNDITLTLPHEATFQSMTVDGRPGTNQPVDGKLTIPLHPGEQTITVVWRDATGIATWFRTPSVDLSLPSVNHSVRVHMPQDRWTLLFFGPGAGPAILIWSRVALMLLIAFLLGQVPLTPLRTRHWALLGLGLTQTSFSGAAVVVATLLAVGWRERTPDRLAPNGPVLRAWLFDLRQLALLGLGFGAVVTLVAAMRTGFFGSPHMEISGNGSSASYLHWFRDRVAPTPETASVLSMPLLVYQLAMLCWALWLAFTIVKQSRWLFQAMGQGGYWRPLRAPRPAKPAPTVTPSPGGDGGAKG